MHKPQHDILHRSRVYIPAIHAWYWFCCWSYKGSERGQFFLLEDRTHIELGQGLNQETKTGRSELERNPPVGSGRWKGTSLDVSG